MSATKTWTPQPVTDMDVECGLHGAVSKLLMPRYNEIPKEFRFECTPWVNGKVPDDFWIDDSNPWIKLVNKWFFASLKDVKFVAKPGIDEVGAGRHLTALMKAWEPEQKHKWAAVAYLMSLWFEEPLP